MQAVERVLQYSAMGPLLTPNGSRAPIVSNWKPPEKTQYFGFLTPNGPMSIAMDKIALVAPALTQNGQPNGMYLIALSVPGVPPVSCQPDDAFHLLKRMGWSDHRF